MSTTAQPTASQKGEHAGKYLTFFLGTEEYGLKILTVHEIIGMMAVTRVPRTPDFILGVINLRGKVIPVVDLRIRFAMDVTVSQDVCVIVVQVRGIQMGIVVDRVSEVVNIAAEEIEPPPSFGVDVPTDFLLGIGKSQGRVKMLLDIDHVLTGTEIVQAASAVAGSASGDDASPAT
ncbi:MAG: chemotaxis protein CheW [Gemmatimonadota bacterium]|nr:chemotaxis protein CheW [Gemmatimonadota bacterium]